MSFSVLEPALLQIFRTILHLPLDFRENHRQRGLASGGFFLCGLLSEDSPYFFFRHSGKICKGMPACFDELSVPANTAATKAKDPGEIGDRWVLSSAMERCQSLDPGNGDCVGHDCSL
jgi:hypothetical protein